MIKVRRQHLLAEDIRCDLENFKALEEISSEERFSSARNFKYICEKYQISMADAIVISFRRHDLLVVSNWDYIWNIIRHFDFDISLMMSLSMILKGEALYESFESANSTCMHYASMLLWTIAAYLHGLRDFHSISRKFILLESFYSLRSFSPCSAILEDILMNMEDCDDEIYRGVLSIVENNSKFLENLSNVNHAKTQINAKELLSTLT